MTLPSPEVTNQRFDERQELTFQQELWAKFFNWCQYFWVLMILVMFITAIGFGDFFHDSLFKIAITFVLYTITTFVVIKYKTH